MRHTRFSLVTGVQTCALPICINERDADALKSQTATAYIDLLTDRELDVRLSAAKAIHKLGIQQAATALLAGLKGDKETAMRVECLSALVDLEAPQQEEAIKFALADREKPLRVAALDLLENMSNQIG